MLIQRILIPIKLLFIAALFFLLSMVFFTQPKEVSRTDYISPPLEIQYLMAGFSIQASDSFWLRAIQDFDYCDQLIAENICKGKSWLFNVVNLSTELDKTFLEAHYFGAIGLTILVSDFAGASVILDKATERFNTDWHILYLAGYHAQIEEKDKLKASRLYLAAVNNGAPDWVRLMAGRLAGEGGDWLKAQDILNQMVGLSMDQRWIEILKKKIEAKAK